MAEYLPRYLEAAVRADLAQKMVFVGGPRQTGKTTLARHFLQHDASEGAGWYLNWDDSEDRELIMRERFPAGSGFLVLDEIHKFARWRQVVKGLYDKRGDALKILITGSARLDYYRRGGDSLQGRYHYYRLFPLSVAELQSPKRSTVDDLLVYGGFPEPFFLASETESRRWSRDYRLRIVRDDLRDLERVHDIDRIELMSLRLPELVGSPLSVNSLREDLSVAHQSVARWLTMLENLYLIFRLYPFGAPRIRAVKKEAKHYHWDWTVIKEPGLRFENLVACHLMKWSSFLQDAEGRDVELRYFRDIDRREVDFVILEEGQPVHFIECKLKDRQISRSLLYLKRKFPAVPATHVCLDATRDVVTKEGIRLAPAHIFLNEYV